ncbi:MAG: TonB-dependent receptor [Gemmatimonadaceae bacterium]|nr:TonB-dependent receptor [Gemmatimonadaceae bacterium]
MRSPGMSWLIALLVLLAAPAAGAQQWPDTQPTVHGPRFLLASSSSPVPVDVRRVAVLRRRIALDLPDASLDEALAAITAQSGLRFMYSNDVMRPSGRVHIRAQEITVAAALTEVLMDAGVDVVLSPNGQAMLTRHEDPRAPRRQNGVIVGTVVDAATHEPIATATVVIEGTRLGTMTNDSGQYRIPNVPPGTVTLSARRIGYAKQTQSVTVTADREVRADFALARSASALEQVVITATGETRNRELGNAVSEIDSASISRAPVNDVQDILVGRTSGVTVLGNSGQPGAGGTIRLRGVNSISQGNSPIIYVDGVRIYNGSTGTSFTGRQTTLPLNDIDASDIDHVEVVKGPAATTLYGTEASGGVIQIFTKHGTAGRPQWTVGVTQGFNNVGHVGPKGDPTGMFLNDCSGVHTSATGVTFQDITCPASGSWLRNGYVQQYNASVRGGTSDVTYYVAGNYEQEAGVLPEGGNKNGGVRGNVTFRPATGFELGLNTSFTQRHVDWFADGNQGQSALLNISRGASSSFKLGTGCASGVTVCLNNAELFDATSFTRQHHYITGFSAKYDAEGPFSARLNLGYDYDDYDLQTEFPFGFEPSFPQGELLGAVRNRTLLTADFAANWKQGIGRDVLSTTSIGAQMFDNRYRSTDLQTQNFAGPGIPVFNSGALTGITGAENSRVINAGFFAQEVVAWRDRVFVTGGLRVDGNSAFGSSFGLQAYPKVSVAYVMSDESWWHVPFVRSLKLRGALGESGKAPGAFDAVRTWSAVAAEDGQPAFTPNQIGNPNLGPERTREIEGGFDLTTADDRVTINATYYAQHTFDALIPVTYPASLGFTSTQLENVGELRNKGIELTASGDIFRRENFTWNARLNYTWVKSTAGDLGGRTITIESLSRTFVKEGYPVPSYFGYKVTNPDAFADPIIDSSAYLGATFPNQIISPAMTFTLWKNLTIDAIGEWQLGGHLLNATAYQNAFVSQTWQPCFSVQEKIRAFQAGDANALDDVTALQRARCTLDGSQRDYAFWVEPTDFFKLRSVTVTYAIPPRLVRGIQNASLSLSGRNLWTSTKYSGTDPEVADIATNSFSRRDYYVFPTYRTFTATLRFGF